MKKLILILSLAFIGVLVFFNNGKIDQSSKTLLLGLNKVAIAQALVDDDKVCCEEDKGDQCKVGKTIVNNYDECN